MASPSKMMKLSDEENAVCGFIHNVSPVKISAKNNRYFTCVVQTDRDTFHRGVVFSPDKHEALEQAAAHKTGVKLLGVKKALNYAGADSGNATYEVHVNRRSSIHVTQVPFSNKKPTDKQRMTLEEVAALPPFQAVGEIHAKVVAFNSSTDMTFIRGADVEVRECRVADATAKMKMLLWEGQVDAVRMGRSYRFCDVSTRKSSVLYITCTKATVIEEICDVEVPASVAAVSVEEMEEELAAVVGHITGVKLEDRRQCGKCGSKQAPFDGKVKHHRCDRCSLLQRTSAYTSFVSGTVVVTPVVGQDCSLILPPSVLRAYMEASNLAGLLEDAEDVEQHLIDAGAFVLQVNTSNVLTRLSRDGRQAEGEAAAGACAANVGSQAERKEPGGASVAAGQLGMEDIASDISQAVALLQNVITDPM